MKENYPEEEVTVLTEEEYKDFCSLTEDYDKVKYIKKRGPVIYTEYGTGFKQVTAIRTLFKNSNILELTFSPREDNWYTVEATLNRELLERMKTPRAILTVKNILFEGLIYNDKKVIANRKKEERFIFRLFRKYT